jgi:hypothetical protein
VLLLVRLSLSLSLSGDHPRDLRTDLEAAV